MQFFICKNCGCIDEVGHSPEGSNWICTECATGEWHHWFDKEPYDKEQHKNINLVNRPGGLEEASFS